MRPIKTRATKSGPRIERCGVCGELGIPGTCDFGKGNPFFISSVHCRTCCTLPERDNWRPLSETEGAAPSSYTRMRRILKKYASGYAKLLGRITNLACGQRMQISKKC